MLEAVNLDISDQEKREAGLVMSGIAVGLNAVNDLPVVLDVLGLREEQDDDKEALWFVCDGCGYKTNVPHKADNHERVYKLHNMKIYEPEE